MGNASGSVFRSSTRIARRSPAGRVAGSTAKYSQSPFASVRVRFEPHGKRRETVLAERARRVRWADARHRRGRVPRRWRPETSRVGSPNATVASREFPPPRLRAGFASRSFVSSRDACPRRSRRTSPPRDTRTDISARSGPGTSRADLESQRARGDVRAIEHPDEVPVAVVHQLRLRRRDHRDVVHPRFEIGHTVLDQTPSATTSGGYRNAASYPVTRRGRRRTALERPETPPETTPRTAAILRRAPPSERTGDAKSAGDASGDRGYASSITSSRSRTVSSFARIETRAYHQEPTGNGGGTTVRSRGSVSTTRAQASSTTFRAQRHVPASHRPFPEQFRGHISFAFALNVAVRMNAAGLDAPVNPGLARNAVARNPRGAESRVRPPHDPFSRNERRPGRVSLGLAACASFTAYTTCVSSCRSHARYAFAAW